MGRWPNERILVGVSHDNWPIVLGGALFCAILVLLLVATAILPKQVGWDSKRGILAAKQYEIGLTPNLVTSKIVDVGNVNEDTTVRVSWWAPGYQALPFGFRQFGLSWQASLKACVCAFTIIGFAAWGCYYYLILGGVGRVLLLLVIIALTHFTASNMTVYRGGDLFLFAAIPLLILINTTAMSVRRKIAGRALSAIGGCAAVGVFLLKYSGVFAGMGIGLLWFVLAIVQRPVRGRFAIWAGAAGVCALLIVVLGIPGTNNPSSGVRPTIVPEAVLIFGTWAVAMADTSAAIVAMAKTVGISGYTAETRIGPALGCLAVGIFAVWVWVFRQRIWEHFRLRADQSTFFKYGAMTGLAAFAFDVLAYAGIVGFGGNVYVCARIAYPTSLIALPFLVEAIYFAGSSKDSDTRLPCIFHTVVKLQFVLLILPGVVLGATIFGRNVATALSGQTEQLTEIRVEGVANQTEFYGELREIVPDRRTVLIVADPKRLLPIPEQRCWYFRRHRFEHEHWAAMRISGIPAYGAAFLVRRRFGDQRTELVRGAFVDIDTNAWRVIPIKSDPRWVVWTAMPDRH